ncbi:hypothetical protein E1091_08660 [Micromonospora fluostatini]|uniref:DUF4192 family protein n=1 Tax=Micromonospora fluostatini TaxID=1629071 RepID=A0ABY2DIG2_9ACTN|nr:hypothetical protein E1091_08660 [Micromonospora fluostatini]
MIGKSRARAPIQVHSDRGSLTGAIPTIGDEDLTGWSAMAGSHQFVVPDDPQAYQLAEALASYGFAYVTGRPSSCGGWMVTAVDEGPYPVDATGHRMMDAVGRAAAIVARQHGGYPQGGSRCDVSMLQILRGPDASIVFANPGARPPMPTIVVVNPPPAAPLTLTPDHVEDTPIDMSGLDQISWAELEHAHGSAEDVPDLLRQLADPFGDWNQTLEELFGDDLLHQGTCYSATAPALPFLTHMITSGALPAKQRLDLYIWLVIAADRWADGLLVDADRAAAEGRSPEPEEWTVDVHLTVGEQLPALFARWESEPPAVRFVLACLASLFPHHGRQISDQITSMALEFDGTQPGAYLQLARALVHHRDDEAFAAATDIVSWEEDHDPDWLDATGLAVAVRAGHVLAEGALRALSNIV